MTVPDVIPPPHEIPPLHEPVVPTGSHHAKETA